MLPYFINDFKIWEKKSLHSSGLFWSSDNKDGGEYSISGNGFRPTLNSYLFAAAKAISEIAIFDHQPQLAKEFEQKAIRLKCLIENKLWDASGEFFKTVPLDKKDGGSICWQFDSIEKRHNVKELYGFIPWKFLLPGQEFNSAWIQLMDTSGFKAPFGLTTAEQRHPQFMKYRVKRCQWDGPVWPFTSSLVLKALANFIINYKQHILSKSDYLYVLLTYAKSQYCTLPYGNKIPWIDENIHPYNDNWLARSIIFERDDPVVGNDLNHGFERGKDYNHSSYADLIICFK
jgi:hypothetical protein